MLAFRAIWLHKSFVNKLSCSQVCYSYLSDSMGSRREALAAG